MTIITAMLAALSAWNAWMIGHAAARADWEGTVLTAAIAVGAGLAVASDAIDWSEARARRRRN